MPDLHIVDQAHEFILRSEMKDSYRNFWHSAMAIIPCLCLLFLCLIPMFVVLHESLVTWDGLRQVGWGSTQGYKEILQPQYVTALSELVFRGVIVATIDIIIGIALADFIVRRKSAIWRWTLLMTLNVPFLVNATSRSYGWLHLLNLNGFVNSFLTSTIPHATPLRWLIYTRTSIVITLIAATLPFVVFPVVLALPSSRNSFWIACDEIGANTGTNSSALFYL